LLCDHIPHSLFRAIIRGTQMDATNQPRFLDTRRGAIIAFWVAAFFLANHVRFLARARHSIRSYVPIAAIPQHWVQASLDLTILILFGGAAISIWRKSLDPERIYLTLFFLIGASGAISKYLSPTYSTLVHWLEAAGELAMIAIAAKTYQDLSSISSRERKEEPSQTT
jgi:hypothetical protein